MQHIFSIIAVAGALATPQVSIATNAPVAVSTCAITDFDNFTGSGEFGPLFSSRMLELTFLNTDDAIATQVYFDVTHNGTHTIVMDRGRFSKGVPIERIFDLDFTAGRAGGKDVCAVVAVTYADGHRWLASDGGTTLL